MNQIIGGSFQTPPWWAHETHKTFPLILEHMVTQYWYFVIVSTTRVLTGPTFLLSIWSHGKKVQKSPLNLFRVGSRFSNRVVSYRNVLPKQVVLVTSVNSFKKKLGSSLENKVRRLAQVHWHTNIVTKESVVYMFQRSSTLRSSYVN